MVYALKIHYKSLFPPCWLPFITRVIFFLSSQINCPIFIPYPGRSPAKPTRPPSAGTARVIPGGPRGGSARGMPGGPRGGSARGMPGGPRGGSARGMAGGPRGKAGASTNARSFYGAAAANILRGQKSRPGFG